MLRKIINEYGQKHWNLISQIFNESLADMAQQKQDAYGQPTILRNGKQCRERWVNFLNPDIKKDPFSLKEDIFLLEKRLEIGNKWAEIIKSMSGRTENNIKNRFNMLLKNMKDEALRKLEYQNIKEASKRGVKPEDLDENALIEELIRRKKLQL